MSVDAPERIWVWPDHIDEPLTGMSEVQQPEHVEYVRADKLEELAAEVVHWNETSKAFRQNWQKAEAALAEAKRENEALQKQVMMLGVQLDDMMFLSVEGFLDWQREQREARNAGGKDAE